jgi:hypothetical protein
MSDPAVGCGDELVEAEVSLGYDPQNRRSVGEIHRDQIGAAKMQGAAESAGHRAAVTMGVGRGSCVGRGGMRIRCHAAVVHGTLAQCAKRKTTCGQGIGRNERPICIETQALRALSRQQLPPKFGHPSA